MYQQKLLKEFFGNNFHQDFLVEADDPQAVIDQYIAESRPEQRAELGRAILDFVKQTDDAELQRKLSSDFNCFYRPAADGLTTREWLRILAARFLTS